MRKLFSILLLSFLMLGSTLRAEVVSYTAFTGHFGVTEDYQYSIASHNNNYYLVVKIIAVVHVESDGSSFFNDPILKIRTFNQEVVTLKGTVVQPKSRYEAVPVGADKQHKPVVYSIAQFPVTAEDMEKIGHGITKIRLTTLPYNHEQIFKKKDKMGLKLYRSYLETKEQEENF